MPNRPTLNLKIPNETGEDVLRLQRLLGAQGYTVEADACFGFGTFKAVKHFRNRKD